VSCSSYVHPFTHPLAIAPSVGQSLSLRKPSFPIRFVHHAHRPSCFVDEEYVITRQVSSIAIINALFISTGIEHCNVLSRGARIGIILGICNFYPFSIVPMDLSISLLETHRRPLSPVDHRLRNTSQATKCPGKPRVYPTNPSCWW
jgi:hypothetical protein